MTAYARKIAEAVRDAVKNVRGWKITTTDAYCDICALDLDAIIAGVPQPQVVDPRDVANFCMMLWHHSARIAPQPQFAEPVAWAAVHFGGKKGGKIFATCETQEQVKAYIDQVHQSDGSITLTARPIAFADAPPQPSQPAASDAARDVQNAKLREPFLRLPYEALTSIHVEEDWSDARERLAYARRVAEAAIRSCEIQLQQRIAEIERLDRAEGEA